jgi:hypothetical protein
VKISFNPKTSDDEARPFLTWPRRFVAWVTDFHKFVTALLAIAGLTIAIHVWLKGLITRKELEVAVEASVEKAVVKGLLEARTDIADLKTSTSGLPSWRQEVTVTIGKLDERLQAASKQGEKNERRIDAYLVVARTGR